MADPTAREPIGTKLLGYSYAAYDVQYAIERLFGKDKVDELLLGIGWDDYDGSVEIFPLEGVDLTITQEINDSILAMGFSRYWINYHDDTEQYCMGERHKTTARRWAGFNAACDHCTHQRLYDRRDAALSREAPHG